ncbi:MAG: MmcQ-like protein [Verrucomicrobia bacterium]|nr:MAG: MmcQ-like protein [Verrucomicrobiota bacterium]
MDAEQFREYCLAKAGVTEGTPFGEDTLVFKVAGKMFALLALDAVPPRVNLKCDPDRALELRDRYEQVLPGYHMNKKHWNTVILDGAVPSQIIVEMIDHSYGLVQAKAKKRR